MQEVEADARAISLQRHHDGVEVVRVRRASARPADLCCGHWIAAVGARTAFIEPGSPWENGYCESFNSKLRDELLDGEIFYSLAEARIVIESWRQHYNTERPHSSLGYKPPAPAVIVPPPATSNPAQRPTMH